MVQIKFYDISLHITTKLCSSTPANGCKIKYTTITKIHGLTDLCGFGTLQLLKQPILKELNLNPNSQGNVFVRKSVILMQTYFWLKRHSDPRLYCQFLTKITTGTPYTRKISFYISLRGHFDGEYYMELFCLKNLSKLRTKNSTHYNIPRNIY